MDTLLEPFGRAGAIRGFVARLLAGVALMALGAVLWGRDVAELALPLITGPMGSWIANIALRNWCWPAGEWSTAPIRCIA